MRRFDHALRKTVRSAGGVGFPIFATMLLGLTACTSAKVDLRHVRAPITMNRNPVLGTASERGVTLEKADTYTGSVVEGMRVLAVPLPGVSVGAGGVNARNSASTNAQKKTGSNSGAALTDVTLDIQTRHCGAFLYQRSEVKISATGNVQRVAGRVER